MVVSSHSRGVVVSIPFRGVVVSIPFRGARRRRCQEAAPGPRRQYPIPGRRRQYPIPRCYGVFNPLIYLLCSSQTIHDLSPRKPVPRHRGRRYMATSQCSPRLRRHPMPAIRYLSVIPAVCILEIRTPSLHRIFFHSATPFKYILHTYRMCRPSARSALLMQARKLLARMGNDPQTAMPISLLHVAKTRATCIRLIGFAV